MATSLRIQDVRKIYRSRDGQLAAVDGVSFTACRGEFIALQGPSGSGKSTLLFILAALLEPDDGSVEVGGIHPYRLGPAARARFRAEKIGMVFQDFRLLPYLDVRRNVLTPTLAAGRSSATPERADELIERLGLAPRSRHLPKQLSAGEQQRTALARALLAKPALLLADEPTGNLDSENAGHVLKQMRLFAEDGGTVLVATHDPATAAAADRSIHLRDGRLGDDK